MKCFNAEQVVRDKIIPFSKASFYRAIKSGVLPHHRIGANIFLTEDDIKQYLDSCAVPARALQSKEAV